MKISAEQKMKDDLELEDRVRQKNQEQADLDMQQLRGGPFPPWYLEKLRLKNQTPDGSEIPDPTVMEPPIGHVEMPSLMQSMYEMIRREKLMAGDLTYEPDTPDEADDFDIEDPDELEPVSAYEFERHFEPEVPSKEEPQERDSHNPQDPPPGGPPSGQGGVGGGRLAPPLRPLESRPDARVTVGLPEEAPGLPCSAQPAQCILDMHCAYSEVPPDGEETHKKSRKRDH